ncbi:hypothetical protein [Alicyclobacillus sp. SO9]|uniref:hypothetical protein n=1 Tax=Alicyclobacillus sp. SO9 TaxID=2665646 RepID=UPI0018E81EB9|nr:hypothetical protein [Alicyclobacillus sp. SO9]QQE77313.1 hypothetical protein GI364_15250 [Alicyclobacillus sp. SO9]
MTQIESSNNSLKSKVEKWLEREGYSLEFLTATSFEKHGHRVFQSKHYEDTDNGILREVDVEADLDFHFDNTLLRITHIVECKWSKDKPWVVFCSSASRKHPGAGIAQSVGSYLGRALLWHIAGENEIYDTSYFATPSEPGFAGRQALASGKDLFYSSIQSVTASSILRAGYYDTQVQNAINIPNYAETVFPVIVVNGPLFKAVYDNTTGKIELEDSRHLRLHWSGSQSWFFDINVDIVSVDYIDEFVERRKEESILLFSSMQKAYINIKECFDAKSLEPMNVNKAPRGFLGLPPLLSNFAESVRILP